MKKEFGLEQIEKDGASVVTVGSFDGVHVGHQAIIRYLVQRAGRREGRSVAVTFEPHPREVLTGHAVPLLTTIDERAQALEALGLDRFIVLPFTQAFAALPPEAFVALLVERIGLREIVVGYDHRFGHGRRGDVALLQAMGAQRGFTVDVIPPQAVDQHVVSSTEIRRLLTEAGDVTEAASMLGRRYALTGTVVQGNRRGRTIGYPTANLAVAPPNRVQPRQGVYAVQVQVDAEERWYGGMMNIGYRPTFDGGGGLHLEVHLFDFDRAIYGCRVRVAFLKRVRDEQKFGSVDALVAQLREDERQCRHILGVETEREG